MWRYVRRRLVLAVLTFWAVSTIVWGLLYLTGDPVAILLAGTPAGQTDVEQLRHAHRPHAHAAQHGGPVDADFLGGPVDDRRVRGRAPLVSRRRRGGNQIPLPARGHA